EKTSEIGAESDTNDARRDDLARIQIRSTHGVLKADDRCRVADVEDVELRRDGATTEPEPPRNTKIDHRHGRQALVASPAERHRLAGPGEHYALGGGNRAGDVDIRLKRIAGVGYHRTGHRDVGG